MRLKIEIGDFEYLAGTYLVNISVSGDALGDSLKNMAMITGDVIDLDIDAINEKVRREQSA